MRRGGAGADLQREGRELGVTQLLQQRPPHQVPLRQPGDGELLWDLEGVLQNCLHLVKSTSLDFMM